jgi:CRISPR type III-B/RAMP module-associated protein Cmr5
MSKQHLQSGRALHAFQVVQKAAQDTNVNNKEFRNSAKKLPMLIKTNGLLPALLFAEVKSQFGPLAEQIMQWLQTEGSPVREYFVNKGNGKLQPSILADMDSQAYRMITLEAQRYLGWVRRFADGLDTQNQE